MNFSEKQSKEIYDFIVKYNSDFNFKNSIQQDYDNNIDKLSMLYIYALEEVIRYGNKGIYSSFARIKSNVSIEQAVKLYDEFVVLFNSDNNFREYKIRQFEETPEDLSEIELFVLDLICGGKTSTKNSGSETLEYDSINPILYATDDQIRETLESLFFGEFIHKILELPDMKDVKERQKQPGQIATIDKQLVIEKVRDALYSQNLMSQFRKIIDSRFVKVKMSILMGKGQDAFDEYISYNTNISSSEIIGKEKDHSTDDIYEFFTNLINEKKKGSGTKK